MSATLGSAESSVRALLVSDDPLTIRQISEPLRELAATTEVCTDLPTAIRLVNTRKFETVVVDLKLGEQTKAILERVRFSAVQSHHCGICDHREHKRIGGSIRGPAAISYWRDRFHPARFAAP